MSYRNPERHPQWPEPIPPEARRDPWMVGNAVMFIFSAEETKLGIGSRQDLIQRGLYTTLESNFIKALQIAQIPKPLPYEVKSRLTSENYHTASEMLGRNGY